MSPVPPAGAGTWDMSDMSDMSSDARGGLSDHVRSGPQLLGNQDLP